MSRGSLWSGGKGRNCLNLLFRSLARPVGAVSTYRASCSLDQQLKKTVDDLQAKLALAKGEYKTALKNLEMISDEIHERRRSSAMGPRGCGVGAEGSSTSIEDLSGSKPEPDAVSGEFWGLVCKWEMTQLVWSASRAVLPSCKGLRAGQARKVVVSHGFPHFVECCIYKGATECSSESGFCGG